jgi:hypothetical protein
MKIYWTTSHSKDRYIIYINDKVYKDHLTFDELYTTWKNLTNK